MSSDISERAAEKTEAPQRESRGRLPIDIRLAVLVGVLAVLCLVGYISQPDTFLNDSNISIMLRLAAAIGVVSVGMTFASVVISAGTASASSALRSA